MLRHGANMDASLLSSFALAAQARPGAPKSLPASCDFRLPPTQKKGTTPRAFSSSFEPPRYQARYFFCPQGSGQGRARLGRMWRLMSASGSVDIGGSLARPPIPPLEPKRTRGQLRRSIPPTPTRCGCQNTHKKALQTPFSPQLPNTRSPWPARKRISSKGQKALFFFTYPLSPVPWSLEDQAGQWVVLEILL